MLAKVVVTVKADPPLAISLRPTMFNVAALGGTRAAWPVGVDRLRRTVWLPWMLGLSMMGTVTLAVVTPLVKISVPETGV